MRARSIVDAGSRESVPVVTFAHAEERSDPRELPENAVHFMAVAVYRS